MPQCCCSLDEIFNLFSVINGTKSTMAKKQQMLCKRKVFESYSNSSEGDIDFDSDDNIKYRHYSPTDCSSNSSSEEEVLESN